MAFTHVSPLKHQIIFPTLKPFLTYKPNTSNPNSINILSPLNSRKVHAVSTNLPTVLKYKDEISRSQEENFPVGLKEELMPKHIAFIMDGNRRWAKEKGLSPMAGHNAMRMTLRHLLRKCSELKIKAVSIYAFSTENWNRPTEEVDFLMEMYEDLLRIDTKELLSLGCRVSVMGNKIKLSEALQKISAEIEEKSRINSGTHVNYAINYSGKYDIIQACKSIATKVNDGVIMPNQINGSMFEQELNTKLIDFPYPDLVIRTSGEIRLSNFMLWQMAYSKLHFVKKNFPDFGENDLIEALHVFQETHKRH